MQNTTWNKENILSPQLMTAKFQCDINLLKAPESTLECLNAGMGKM